MISRKLLFMSESNSWQDLTLTYKMGNFFKQNIIIIAKIRRKQNRMQVVVMVPCTSTLEKHPKYTSHYFIYVHSTTAAHRIPNDHHQGSTPEETDFDQIKS